VRALALVSPNNPTGSIYSPELLAALYEICRARGIFMILDETYRDFLPPERRQPHALFDRPGWDETLISLYSFSKGFCIPGHRLGAVIGSRALVGELVKIMDGLQICAPRTGQIALAEALPVLTEWHEANRVEVNARAARLLAVMAGCPGWDVAAIGAYFAFVRHPFRQQRSAAVAERLARNVGVVTVPGSYFGPGQEDFLRFAFANADVPTLDGLAPRLTRFMHGHTGASLAGVA
jgi:aspartate/methionine/tyrosine aminotransferase